MRAQVNLVYRKIAYTFVNVFAYRAYYYHYVVAERRFVNL